MAQSIIEIQTVQDAWPILEAEDVLGHQVAVSINHRRRGPECAQLLSAAEVALHETFYVGQHGGGHHVDVRRHLREAALPELSQRLGRDIAGDRVASIGACVEGSERASDLTQACVYVRPGLNEGREPTFLRHAAHENDVMQHVPVGPDQIRHAGVDVGSDSPVQVHLALAGFTTPSDRREVEEPPGPPAS